MELVELDKHRIGFITFRAHVSQPHIFEDFMSVFIPYISSNFSIYTYSVEKDDSPDRHIHMALVVDEKIYDTQKLKQKIEAKWFRDFKDRCHLGPTDIKHAYVLKFNEDPDDNTTKIKMNQLDHKMKIIGYIHKDINRRTEIRGLSQSLITACCDFYFANRRIQNKVDNDWKLLTTKNIHVKIEEYCKETGQDVMSPLLQFNMVKDKHSFIQLSTKQRKMAFAELRYHQGNNDPQIRQDLTDDSEQLDIQEYGFSKSDYVAKLENYQDEIHKLKMENEQLKIMLSKK